MKIRNMMAASVVALLPFAMAGAAKASASDCWTGDTNDRALEHSDCNVEVYDHPDGGVYYEITLGIESIRVDLWEDDDGQPTKADLVTTNLRTGKVSEGSYEYVIDSDGDAKIGIGDFRFVFRFPDHPDAGTGRTQLAPDRPGRANPASRDGLRPGDLSNTPFRF